MSSRDRDQLNSRKESFQPDSNQGVPSSTPEAKWKGLVRNGVFPEITSLNEYDKIVTEGMARTRHIIEASPTNSPTPQTALEYHHQMFKDVHPWAGEFRTVGQTVIIGEFFGADPQRIDREMELWSRQSQDMLSKSRSAQDALAAIAFSHIRFERCHPFKDGNGRTGRALMHSQLEATFGHRDRERLLRSEYFTAIRQSQGKEPDLTAFVQLLAKREGLQFDIREKILSPYRLAPFFHPVHEKTFQQDLVDSQKGTTSLIQVEKLGLWDRVKRIMGFDKGPKDVEQKQIAQPDQVEQSELRQQLKASQERMKLEQVNKRLADTIKSLEQQQKVTPPKGRSAKSRDERGRDGRD